MLKYIQHFVQTFLREASRSRPKSRKSSRSSTDLTKEKTPVKPEVLSIGFNTEAPEAERSKEILELKKTYSLLMKKFVNPKLDLMSTSRQASEINILNLKGKQELIKSVLNQVYNEFTGQKNQLASSSTEITEANLKSTDEEISVGWSGQQTSKLAANPVVETSKPSKISSSEYVNGKITTDLDSESLNESKASKGGQIISKTKYRRFPTKDKSEEKLQPSLKSLFEVIENPTNPSIERNNMTQYNKKENINIIRSITKIDKGKVTNLETQTLKGKNDTKFVKNIESNKGEVNHINKKKNVNKLAEKQKLGTEEVKSKKPLKEKYERRSDETSNSSIHLKESLRESLPKWTKLQNKVDQNKINDQKKSVKHGKITTNKQIVGAGVTKALVSDKTGAGKNQKSTSSTMNFNDSLLHSEPGGFKLPPSYGKEAKETHKAENKHSENVELGTLKSTANEETDKKTIISLGETLSKPNIECVEKVENHKSHNEVKYAVCDSKEPPFTDNMEKDDKDGGKLTNVVEDENLKSTNNNYWNTLSNKLLKTANDTQKYINSFELSNWRIKDVSAPDAFTKHEIVSDSLKDTDKYDCKAAPISSDLKKNGCDQSGEKQTEIDKTKQFQDTGFKGSAKDNKSQTKIEENHHSSQKYLTASRKANLSEPQSQESQRRNSKSVDLYLGKVTSDMRKNSDHNVKHNKFTTKNDHYLSGKVTEALRSNSNVSTKSTGKRGKDSKSKNLKNVELKVTKTDTLETHMPNTSSEKHEGQKTEIDQQKDNIIGSLKTTIPKEDSKINKLLKRFKKIQKNKSKPNLGSVQRVYSKIVNDSKLSKMSLHKFRVNKDKHVINKVRRAMRKKSGNVAIDKTLSTESPIKLEGQSKFSHVVTKANTLDTKKNETVFKNQKSSDSFTKSVRKPVKPIKLNRINSNIFPSRVKKNIVDNGFKDIDRHKMSKSAGFALKETDHYNMNRSCSEIVTKIDLGKARKLHSRKEFCKPSKLQMYGVKRSIYTDSNTEADQSQDTYKLFTTENITEPNLASRSLINITGLKPNSHANVYLTATQRRKLHTSRFRGEVNRLNRNKKTTVIKVKENTKAIETLNHKNDDSMETKGSKCDQAMEKSKVAISKTGEIKLKSDPILGTVKSIHKRCPELSSGGDLLKDSSLKIIGSNQENKCKISDGKCSSKDKEGTSSVNRPTKSKLDDNTEDQSIQPLPRCKAGAEIVSNSTSLHEQRDDPKTNSLEAGSNLNIKTVQSPLGSVEIPDSPKWKSKEDRLEKWRLEVKSDNVEVTMKNTAETNEIKIDENKCTLVKDVETNAKDDHGSKTITLTNLGAEKNNTLSTKIENKDLYKDAFTPLIPVTKSNEISLKNKTENNCVFITKDKDESNHEKDEQTMKDASKHKIKEFESKLKVLESKLKALEFKSVVENNKENFSKTNALKALGLETPSSEINHVMTNQNKVRIQGYTKKSQIVPIENLSQNKNKTTNTLYVKDDKISSNTDKTDQLKEQLFQKVKGLEFKLKILETTLKDLKNKPTDSDNSKELIVKASTARLSDWGSNPNPMKSSHLINESNMDNGKLKTLSNSNNNTDQNKGKNGENAVYTKPEVYLKRHLTYSKNDFEEKFQSKNKKVINNNKSHPSNTSILLSPQSTVKSTTKSTGKILEQKIKPNNSKSPEIREVKKMVSPVTKKIDLQPNEYLPKKASFSSFKARNQPLGNGSEKGTKQIKKDNGEKHNYVTQYILKQNLNRSYNFNNNEKSNTNTKDKYLSKSMLTSATKPFTLNSQSVKGKKSNKVNNINENRVNNYVTIPPTKILNKISSFNVDKKMSLKKNSAQHPKKIYSKLDSRTNTKVAGRKNTLNEANKKCSRRLNSVGSEESNTQKNVSDRVYSSSPTKFLSNENLFKPPVFPKKISNVLNNLKTTPEKQDYKESKEGSKRNSHSDPKGLSNSQSIQIQTPSKSDKSGKIVLGGKFNSFDYYRPKRRSYEVKHPIENEKYGMDFYGKNDNILDKFRSQNFSIPSIQNIVGHRSEKESAMFHKMSDININSLMAHKTLRTVKSIQK